MLLESSLLMINIFSKNIYLLLNMLIFLLILNFYRDKTFFNKIKKIGKFMLIYLFYLLISVFFYKTGKILISFGKLYITYEGLIKSLTIFLRLINLLLLSFLITTKFKNKRMVFSRKNEKLREFENYYSEIFEHIFETVPFIFELISKKVKFSDSYKKILLKVYRNL